MTVTHRPNLALQINVAVVKPTIRASRSLRRQTLLVSLLPCSTIIVQHFETCLHCCFRTMEKKLYELFTS